MAVTHIAKLISLAVLTCSSIKSPFYFVQCGQKLNFSNLINIDEIGNVSYFKSTRHNFLNDLSWVPSNRSEGIVSNHSSSASGGEKKQTKNPAPNQNFFGEFTSLLSKSLPKIDK